MDLVDNGGNRFSIPFSTPRNREAKIVDHLKKAQILNFEKRERNYANTWGSGDHARGQKKFQKRFYCISFVFITICSHSASTFMRF